VTTEDRDADSDAADPTVAALRAIAGSGLVLLGCGKMGSALLDGWLSRGLPPGAVTVIDPQPGPRLEALAREGLRLNTILPAAPAVCIVAVKPQMMGAALPQVAPLGGGPTLVMSIAAGTPLATFEAAFGPDTPIVRSMPNTPAAIGRGITALVGNAAAGEPGLARAEALLAAVGGTVRLADEGQMDAVTAVSGSGPAYVFLLIEAMADAGRAEGLAPELALALARATVAGAGALAMDAEEDPATLRANVTSPGGTTAAALAVLMDDERGLPPLMRAAVAAAAARGRELAG
jgi:pyrroline-5-carboxylate reductase